MANKSITQLAVWQNNSFNFAFLNLNAPTNIVQGISYWQIKYIFGLVYQGVTDPNKVIKRGKPGDYVYLDPSTGALYILTKATYNHRFPVQVYTTTATNNMKSSKKLQENPAKYTSLGYNSSNDPTTTSPVQAGY